MLLVIPALRERRTRTALLTVLAVSGVGWWLLLAGPSMLQIFICGADGFGPLGGAWNAGRLLSLSGMWVAMAAAMLLPVGVLSLMRMRGAEFGVFSSVAAPACPAFLMRIASRVEQYLPGYLAFLLLISIAAAMSQWVLESAGLIDERERLANPLLAGALLAGIGIWQVAQLFRRHAPCGTTGERHGATFLQGWRHGCSSLGCCLTMAGLQFAGGAMNIGLMLGLTLWMLLETALPWKRELAASAGIALLTAGGLTMAGAIG